MSSVTTITLPAAPVPFFQASQVQATGNTTVSPSSAQPGISLVKLTNGTNNDAAPKAFPDAAAEALRQVLYAPDAPPNIDSATLAHLMDTPAQQKLRALRRRWRDAHQRPREGAGREFPSPEALRRVAHALRGALFPMRLGPSNLRQEGEDFYVGHTIENALNELLEQIRLELRGTAARAGDGLAAADQRAVQIVQSLAADLPAVRAELDQDVEAAYRGDPAAHSVDEVLLCYPGVHAMIHHRIAHELYMLGVPT